jgi:hypothetical protein
VQEILPQPSHRLGNLRPWVGEIDAPDWKMNLLVHGAVLPLALRAGRGTDAQSSGEDFGLRSSEGVEEAGEYGRIDLASCVPKMKAVVYCFDV